MLDRNYSSTPLVEQVDCIMDHLEVLLAQFDIPNSFERTLLRVKLVDVLTSCPEVRLYDALNDDRFRPGDFMHDIGGILQHWNLQTQQFDDFFCPRCWLEDARA